VIQWRNTCSPGRKVMKANVTVWLRSIQSRCC
jgi:hypothetical protein